MKSVPKGRSAGSASGPVGKPAGSPSRRIQVGEWNVRIDGPESRHTVLLLPDAGDPADVYEKVWTRLHTSDLRTITVESIEGLDVAGVHAILDEVKVPWVHVAARGAGAELAWQACARGFGRFISLVVADRGHPAVPGADGVALDPSCPAVELPTTLLVTKNIPRSVADASGRYVYGELRLVDIDASNVATEADHELTTEIVLRTSLW